MIELFPRHVLDNSLHTPVLIGLALQLLFTELFGWAFVGYVVPGYLAVIFLTFPESGFAILIEAVLTYQLVVLLSEIPSKLGIWARFFGRERFFLFVFASVVVRLLCEGVVFPAISPVVENLAGFKLEESFFSIGLVLTPLVANSFWKPGLARGLVQKLVPTLLTFLMLKYVLVRYTNMDFSMFELTFEDLALSFLASPKLYVIILISALLASAFNVRFGWDFNGIMVPALLAIAVFYPHKILATVAEALLAAGVFVGLTSLPYLKKLNFGGGRKITAVFFLAYLMKWILASVVPTMEGLRASDFFGFGYVLPSLMSVKILEKHSAARVVLPTVFTSVYSWISATAIGILLIVGSMLTQPVYGEQPQTRTAQLLPTGNLFEDVLLMRAYVIEGSQVRDRVPSFKVKRAFAQAVALAIDGKPEQACREATAATLACEIKRDPLYGEYVLIHENVVDPGELRGFGTALIRTQATGPVLFVLRPLLEPESLEAAFLLIDGLNARAVIVSGTDKSEGAPGWTDSIKSAAAPITAIGLAIHHHDFVLLRTGTERSLLRIRYRLPRSISVVRLRSLFGEVALSWKVPHPKPALWRSVSNPICVLSLSREAVRNRFLSLRSAWPLVQMRSELTVRGIIEKWMVEQKEYILPEGSERYRPPRWWEMVLLRKEIVSRLFAAADEYATQQERLHQLELASFAAELLGLEIVQFEDEATQSTFLILRHATETTNRGWGTLAVRVGEARPWMFVVPRPLEEGGTVAAAAHWFQEFHARALLLAGASANANSDGSANILSETAPKSAAWGTAVEFMLTYGLEPAWMLALVRGTRDWRLSGADLLLSTGEETIAEGQLGPGVRAFKQGIESHGLQVALFAGLALQLDLQGAMNPFGRLVRTFDREAFASVWVGRSVRASFLEGARLAHTLDVLKSLGVQVSMGATRLWQQWLRTPSQIGSCSLSAHTVKKLLLDFGEHINLYALRTLLRMRCGKVRAFADLQQTQVFVGIAFDRQKCLTAVGTQVRLDPNSLQLPQGARIEDNCIRFLSTQ